MRTLDRYLLRELALPFLAGLGGFLLIFIGTFLFTILDLLVRKVPVALLAKLVLYRVPFLVVHVLPYATLFAVCLAMSRLVREGEVTAIRMSGTSLVRVVWPLALAGLAVSLVSLLLSEGVSPVTNHVSMGIYRQLLLGPTRPDLRQDVFFRAQDYTFYVRRVERSSEGRYVLTDVMVYEPRPERRRFPALTTARSATADGSGLRWRLRDGARIELGADGFSSREWTFDELTLDLQSGIEDYLAEQKTPEEMSAGELRRQIELFGKGGIEVSSLKVDYQAKLAFPFACLVLTLLSVPLTVHFSRGGPSMGFLVVIGLFFLYYNTYFLAKVLGSSGLVAPALAAWGPNVVFGALGLALLRREE